jgi:cytochrome P450
VFDTSAAFRAPEMMNLGDAALRADPYPTYARLRRESPVAAAKVPSFGRAFLITRYDDVLAAHKNPALSSDLGKRGGSGARVMPGWMPRVFSTLQRSMVTTDDPDHWRLRELVHQAFTPATVERMARRIETITTELLDRAATRREIDLIADFALPLPLRVISDMMGVDDRDQRRFHRWSSGFLEVGAGDLWVLLRQIPNGIRMLRFFERLIARRRQHPGDDLVSRLVQAESGGDRLSEQELLSMIFLLLLAGHETTVNLIANGMLALLQNRSELERLRAHPEHIDTAVEELLRYGNPVEHGNVRIALEDVTIAGVPIPKGSTVVLLLASANRDEAVFPRPEQLDIARTPNRHLAFGFGIHYCLGAPLARMEGRVAIQQLVSRFPDMHLAVPVEKLRWRQSVAVRGVKKLPVRLTGGRARENSDPREAPLV